LIAFFIASSLSESLQPTLKTDRRRLEQEFFVSGKESGGCVLGQRGFYNKLSCESTALARAAVQIHADAG
jgi:hypothetical protein